MKLAIIGSRSFDNYLLLESTIFSRYFKDDEYVVKEIVSGGAIGADRLAKKFAETYGIKLKEFLPEYDKYPGKIAPLKRNEQIIEYADEVLAFWSGSSGTGHALSIAKKLKKPTFIIYF